MLTKAVFSLLSALVLTLYAERVVRSPDKMEVSIPNYSYERDSGEHQENMNQEAEYWQGQGDKVGEKEQEGHQQMEEDREKNQETYEHEKEHTVDQQQNFNNELNNTYQEDKDKTENQHDKNEEHYMHHHDNTNYETPNTNKTFEDMTETETGDRYEEKGTEFVDNEQDKMENHDVNEDAPSITYTRT